MYPYHNRIRQRIKAGELHSAVAVSDYPSIGPCIVLIFSTWPHISTIRPQWYPEYEKFLGNKMPDINRPGSWFELTFEEIKPMPRGEVET